MNQTPDESTPVERSPTVIPTRRDLSFPGFAIPKTALHSIPLPEDFDKQLAEAITKNHVKSVFPKFFNPLLRKQGVVNKHTLQALGSVGAALSLLGSEIETRDRILENLVAYLNAQNENTQNQHGVVAKLNAEAFAQINKLAEAIRSADQRITEHAAAVKAESGTLVNAIRIDEQSIAWLQGQVSSLLQSADSSAAAARDFNARLNSQNTQSVIRDSALLASVRTLDNAVSGIRTTAVGMVSGCRVEIERVRHDATRLEQELVTRIGRLEECLSTKLADIEHRIELATSGLSGRLDAIASAVENRIDATQKRIDDSSSAFTVRVDAAQRHSEQTRSEVTELIGKFEKELSARIATNDKRIEYGRSEVAEQSERSTRKLSSELDAIRAGFADLRQSAGARLDTLELANSASSASLRAADVLHASLSAELSSVRDDLLCLAEQQGVMTKRIAAVIAETGGLSSQVNTALPSISSALRSLGKETQGNNAANSVALISAALSDADRSKAEAFYVALENRFRGPRKSIRERLLHHLPRIDEARCQIERLPQPLVTPNSAHPNLQGTPFVVLDLGCGRGEWLQLLKEQGVPAVGIDLNRYFLEECRRADLRVYEADLIAFLQTVPDNSIGAVTAFHVIEHLPFSVLQEMASQVQRVLRRGGVALFETPNPANVLTSSLNFHLDPTHLKPVHGLCAQFLMESAGFSPVRIEYLHPYEESERINSSNNPLAAKFNDLFFGPQDYAVIAIKP